MSHLLSVVIPVFNEEKTVETMLDRVAAAQTHDLRLELVIVNDGSTDRSPELIRGWVEAHPEVQAVCIDKENGGKGSAVKMAVAATSGEAVIIQDADLEYDPADYAACAGPVFSGECEVVYGSREESNRNRIYSSPGFYLGALSLTFLVDLLFNANLTDEATCYKTFRGCLIRAMVDDLEGDGFEWEPEITAKLLRLGIHPYEVPISYYPRKPEDGKKIRFRDGLLSIWTAYEWRFRSVRRIRKRVASLSDVDEEHVRHVKYAQGAFLLSMLAAVLPVELLSAAIGSGDSLAPSRLGYVAAAGLVYLTARLYQPWKLAFLWSLLSTAALGFFLPASSDGLIELIMTGANDAMLGALNLTVYRGLGLDLMFPYADPASLALAGFCLQMFFYLKFAACGFVLFFITAMFFCWATALLMPLNIWWMVPALAGLLLQRGNKFRVMGAAATAVLMLCLLPAILKFDWSPFVPAVCTDLKRLMLWTAAPLLLFAVAPVASLLKHRRLLPWVVFLGFLPYFAVCPPFLFPFLAAFRAEPSRFKRM
jgi:glycosyltransferase involved in cell wall biosynthesis